jgi:Protein of unknown function (DUF2852)
MTNMPQDRAETPFLPAPPHIVVQILGLLLFGGFAIVATVLAFVSFWPAGVALAIVLAWFGFGPILSHRHTRQRVDWFKSATTQLQSDRTGNTSFDAYRTEVLKRLEDEQKTFVSFLDRLRDAKDKSEFDNFMDDRAKAFTLDAPEAAKPGNY